MSDADSRNGREATPIPDGGILAALPRTRPQRATARRVASREDGARVHATASKQAASERAGSEQAGTGKTMRQADTSKTKRVSTGAPTAERPARERRGRKTAANTAKSAARRRAGTVKPKEPRAPKQGYEPEEEIELGTTVDPPSGLELLESAADIVGELAGTSLAAGGRLLKDAFSILRRP